LLLKIDGSVQGLTHRLIIITIRTGGVSHDTVYCITHGSQLSVLFDTKKTRSTWDLRPYI